LNQKFGELYVEVIGPNFKAVVEEFLVNSEDEPEGNENLYVVVILLILVLVSH